MDEQIKINELFLAMFKTNAENVASLTRIVLDLKEELNLKK